MTTLTDLTASLLLQHAVALSGCTALDFDQIQCVAAGQLPYLTVEAATTVLLDLMHDVDMIELHRKPTRARLELWARTSPTVGPNAWAMARAAEWIVAARTRAIEAVEADMLAAATAV